MLFSNVSILVATALAAFATSAMACNSSPKCCVSKLLADDTNKKWVLDKLGVVISNGAYVWFTCDDLSLVTSGGAICPGEAVCCEKTASDGSIAIGCKPL